MVPRHVIQETCKIQDSSVTVQVPQTEQPPASNSVRETVNTQDSSLKVGGMLVRVLPINTLVKVNATDDVKKLREMLFQSQQRGQIQKLPRDGYFLTHKKKVLKEDQSYEWNGIKNAGTIVIVPRRWTQDTSKIQDSSVTVRRSNRNHQVLQTEHIINRPQDSTVTVQVPQTEQSPASNSVLSLEEISDILNAPENDPKQKKKVYVMPFSIECKGVKRFIEVELSSTDQVKILRNELVESIRRGYIKLPLEGYFFADRKKERILNEDQSFEWNGVLGPAETVYMVPRRYELSFTRAS
ncbi:unnamed protein product [Arabidopsis arenosa]|uniref:Ubiquitin-like domain-containing protein n=1 Tax=Arabidopsis arenosa TaxID=38785 RepID=A0A8S2AMD1_ARAAE|nr:unnamed protein product [Arabidopsis arenosa]